MILTGKLNLLAFFMCLSFLGMSQTGTLRGKVKDLETGETLPGVSVLIVGTYKVATSDFDGN